MNSRTSARQFLSASAKPADTRKKKWIPAEVPQRKDEVIPYDPLNYLVKYSIVHKERLSFYERVFQQHVSNQAFKYQDEFKKVFGVEPPRREKTFIQGPPEEGAEEEEDVEEEAYASDYDEGLLPEGEDDMDDTAMAALESEGEKETAAEEKKASKKKPKKGGKGGKKSKKKKKPGNVIVQLKEHERSMIRDLTLISRVQSSLPPPAGTSDSDLHLARIQFTLRTLEKKLLVYRRHVMQLREEKKRLIIEAAKANVPGIKHAEFEPAGGGKKKKPAKEKKKKKAAGGKVLFGPDETGESGKAGKKATLEEEELSDMEFLQPPAPLALPESDDKQKPVKKLSPGEVSDDTIYKRVEDDDALMEMLEEDETVKEVMLEIERMLEKIEEVKERVAETAMEEKLLLAYSNEVYLAGETAVEQTEHFRRAQSATYKRLHPVFDYEMNTSELEAALRDINSSLITEKEMQYIYHVLDLPGRRRVNFKLFSVVAAMSERVAQLDPLIRKLINKFDFEALQVKLEKCKELFYLLCEADQDAPKGQITVESLIVELTAGGIAPENIQYVVSKMNRERRGIIDILDFMSLVPLFAEIHQRIVTDPFSRERSF